MTCESASTHKKQSAQKTRQNKISLHFLSFSSTVNKAIEPAELMALYTIIYDIPVCKTSFGFAVYIRAI